MEGFHERLAQIGLAVGAVYGFALAGGYAVQAAGMVVRPSEDVDLFTAWDRRGDFDAAVEAVVAAYQADGLSVEVRTRFETFARLMVSDPATGQRSKVELGADWRSHAPVSLAIGPVLHPDDAVANKMAALFGRAEPRDFVDIYGILTSGRYDQEQLLALVEAADPGFDRRMFADALAVAATIEDARFGAYGVAGERLAALRTLLAAWRADILTSASG